MNSLQNFATDHFVFRKTCGHVGDGTPKTRHFGCGYCAPRGNLSIPSGRFECNFSSISECQMCVPQGR